MSSHHDAHDPAQPDANRPPQLNKTVCGCRCGRGGTHEGGGGNRDDDVVSTLVASEGSDVGEEFANSSGFTTLASSLEMQPPSPVAMEHIEEFQTRNAHLNDGAEGLQRRADLHDFFLPPRQFEVFHDYDMDSMSNGPGSDLHSVVAPDSGSIRCISPGPGLGAWMDELPLEYHFLVRPLRLTPQHQYCRGLVASHLVLRDGVDLEDMQAGNGAGRRGSGDRL